MPILTEERLSSCWLLVLLMSWIMYKLFKRLDHLRSDGSLTLSARWAALFGLFLFFPQALMWLLSRGLALLGAKTGRVFCSLETTKKELHSFGIGRWLPLLFLIHWHVVFLLLIFTFNQPSHWGMFLYFEWPPVQRFWGDVSISCTSCLAATPPNFLRVSCLQSCAEARGLFWLARHTHY